MCRCKLCLEAESNRWKLMCFQDQNWCFVFDKTPILALSGQGIHEPAHKSAIVLSL